MCISIGTLLFSTYNALGKWLAADYSRWQDVEKVLS